MRIKIIVLLLIAGSCVWLLRGDEVADTDNPMLQRVWLDHVPQSLDEKFDLFAMIDDPERAGVFLHTSAFEGDYAVFGWNHMRRGRVDIVMLQTGKRHTLRATVSRRGCDGYDYCMTLEGAPRGARRYVSMDDWVIESHRINPDELRRFVASRLGSR